MPKRSVKHMRALTNWPEYSLCGIAAYKPFTTNDATKVTCKSCIRTLTKMVAEKLK